MKYSDIVHPDELTIAREWARKALATARTAPAAPSAQSSAEVKCIRQDWAELETGRSILKEPLRLNGKTYDDGYGTHAESVISVKLAKPARRITALAGVEDNPNTREQTAIVVFSIEASGKELWRSRPLVVSDDPAKADVLLKGARNLTLKTFGPKGIFHAHAAWANIDVTYSDGTTERLGRRVPFQESPCFSFIYGDKFSDGFLRSWPLKEENLTQPDGVKLNRLIWTDPKTKLQCTLEMKQYPDFPVVEWLLRFRNCGRKDTSVLEDIHSMDLRLQADPKENPVLHYQTGDYNAVDGYEPHVKPLTPGAELAVAPEGGRPTNKAFPYFNLEFTGRGMITVVGWSGQWAAKFNRVSQELLRIQAGQELTHFTLHPGEEVRTPLSVLLFWKGDFIRSQNIWRRWMMAWNMPRTADGSLPPPILPGNTSLWFSEMENANEENQKYFIDRWVEEGINLTHWWMDAGWYETHTGKWWTTGTWKVDKKRFPHGLRAISDHAKRKGIQTLVWFEPERVAVNTWLYNKRPKWLLGKDGNQKLLDLGNPKALKWLIDHVQSILTHEGIHLYRQDFNFDPLPYWRANDAPDRQGITEIRHVEGYLRYWSELRRMNPGMIIDSCASGGRRNDLETLRLSVPLHKTDYNYWDLPAKQAMHYGLSWWMPYYGAPVLPEHSIDVYAFRSALALCTAIGFDMRRTDLDFALLKKLAAERRKVVDFMYGDFYPLTPYNRDGAQWISWQFDRPDKDAGMVQAFRRSQSPYSAAVFHLRGLDTSATYSITDMDTPSKSVRVSGKKLVEEGLTVSMSAAPQAKIIVYKKAR